MTAAAERVRAYRSRRDKGRRILQVEVDEMALSAFLTSAGIMTPLTDSPRSLDAAVERFLQLAVLDNEREHR